MLQNRGARARTAGAARLSKAVLTQDPQQLQVPFRSRTTLQQNTRDVLSGQRCAGGGRTQTTWPSKASATWSTIGAIMRQGPHHGAQKSTNTGRGLSSTISWNVLSVTSIAAPCDTRLGAGVGSVVPKRHRRARQPRRLLAQRTTPRVCARALARGTRTFR